MVRRFIMVTCRSERRGTPGIEVVLGRTAGRRVRSRRIRPIQATRATRATRCTADRFTVRPIPSLGSEFQAGTFRSSSRVSRRLSGKAQKRTPDRSERSGVVVVGSEMEQRLVGLGCGLRLEILVEPVGDRAEIRGQHARPQAVSGPFLDDQLDRHAGFLELLDDDFGLLQWH